MDYLSSKETVNTISSRSVAKQIQGRTSNLLRHKIFWQENLSSVFFCVSYVPSRPAKKITPRHINFLLFLRKHSKVCQENIASHSCENIPSVPLSLENMMGADISHRRVLVERRASLSLFHILAPTGRSCLVQITGFP